MHWILHKVPHLLRTDLETWITGPIPFLPDGMAGNDLTGDVLVNLMHRDPEFNLDNFDITRDRDKVLDVTATISPSNRSF